MVDNGKPVYIAVDSVVGAFSPRLTGEDAEHVRLLAQCETELPPILVHHPSMRVIDGVHRLQAARLRGHDQILARYFSGDEEEAFLLAVKENVAHGLPLTLADRTAAATRIIRAHPEWSDRALARITGLSAKTVGAVRRRTSEEIPQSYTRIGRDGRARPLDAAAGRVRAGELITANPDASLREIAREAGVSPSTVRDVRRRLRQGCDPVPQRSAGYEVIDPVDRAQERARLLAMLPVLRKDPTLRFTESGRTLLRLLEMTTVDDAEWQRLMASVPAHWLDAISALSRACAERWQTGADQLDRRRRASA